MILYDFSSVLHRSIHTAIKNTNPHKINGKYKTDEFIGLAINRILNELFECVAKYSSEYGEFVICMDNHSKDYWRKDIYPDYKGQRKKIRDESEINWNEVFKHLNLLSKVLNDYTPWKCINAERTEADDIIGVLCRKFAKFEKILILSPDKDFKQLHKLGDIKQYSSLTNDWITCNSDEFMLEHILLGDAVDNIPRIVDFSEFTDEFKNFLNSKNLKYSELEFYNLDYNIKSKLLNEFDGQAFVKSRFGITTAKKKIKEFGSLDNFLDSNPIYRLNFERNRKLVLDAEIPVNIEINILKEFNESSTKFDLPKIIKYLNYYKLKSNIQDFVNLSNFYSKVVELNEENFDSFISNI